MTSPPTDLTQKVAVGGGNGFLCSGALAIVHAVSAALSTMSTQSQGHQMVL